MLSKSSIILICLAIFFAILSVLTYFSFRPYFALQRCQINTSIVVEGINFSIYNPTDEVAIFPHVKGKVFYDSAYAFDLNIPEMVIKPGETKWHIIEMEHVNLTNRTLIFKGKIFLKIAYIPTPIPFEIERSPIGKVEAKVFGIPILKK